MNKEDWLISLQDYNQLHVFFQEKINLFLNSYSFFNTENFSRENFRNSENNINGFSDLYGINRNIHNLFQSALVRVFIYYQKYETPYNIINHSINVSLTSLFLLFSGLANFNSDKKQPGSGTTIQAKEKKSKLFNFLKNLDRFFSPINKTVINHKLNLFLSAFISSGLLHDIGKLYEINGADVQGKKLSHAEKGAFILKNEGLYFESIICRDHLIDSFILNEISLPSKIVNMADKMVTHSKSVPLEQRFLDLFHRYPRYSDKFSRINLTAYEQFYSDLTGEKIACSSLHTNLPVTRSNGFGIFQEKINSILNIF